jgi:hypothetical protein
MRLIVDDTTRFFSVVGAPFIAESHLDEPCEPQHAPAWRVGDRGPAIVPWAVPAGWWLDDNR